MTEATLAPASASAMTAKAGAFGLNLVLTGLLPHELIRPAL
jgi:hypothetical protein